ncbi:hypothetical protein F7Q99_08605 [Streptomyces kaniharaensis]|uniref:Uncharacterized protein n=1 Tax=Streptomyces kaniharaensis TaxID=212423 RepID=A0A6N7KPT3_9ACTN|nr:hypothetical protein [Streptomyces kaniharaensis]MQS12347.1 hypothetical protein [Streptomyces kaniharaensis]
MRARKALPALALPLALPLVLVAAPAAVAAETTVVVTGARSAPGGWSTATCPAHTHLTGGGYTFAPAAPGDTVLVNAPVPSDPGTWSARAELGVVTAYALCETEG